MSSNKIENLNLNSESNLLKFLVKKLSVESFNDKILFRKCKNNKKIQRAKNSTVSNSYDHRLLFIMKIIDCYIEYLKQSLEIVNGKSINNKFLLYVEIFIEHIYAKLKETPKITFEKQNIIKEILHKTEEHKNKYQKSLFSLNKKISDLNEVRLLKEKNISVINYYQQIFKEDIEQDIINYIYNGNIRRIKKLKLRKDAETYLRFLEKNAQNKYRMLQKINITYQKQLTEQKLKAEQALQSILLKLDNDVGSRVEEIKLIEDNMNAKKLKFEEWKLTTFAQQEASYIELMKEKEEEELRYREEKLEEIKLNHAAKVIQYSWNKYKAKQKMLIKKKGKKKNVPKRIR